MDSRDIPPTSPPSDVLSLVSAPMTDLVAALVAEETIAHRSGAVPARALQIANLVAAEATRLIRLGTRSELTEAGVALAKLLAGPGGERLKREQPAAHRVVSGISVALKAASAPSSSGGELTVLRSWSGNASAAVAELRRASEHKMMRADLRRALDVDESYLSHLLSDLEAASLVVRIREGREVAVHLGPAGRSEHVGRYLRGLEGDDAVAGRAGGRRAVEELFREILDGARNVTRKTDDIVRLVLRRATELEGRAELEKQVESLRRMLRIVDTAIETTLVGEGLVVCEIRIAGVPANSVWHREPVEERRFWIARVEDDQPVSVEAWSRDVVSWWSHAAELPARGFKDFTFKDYTFHKHGAETVTLDTAALVAPTYHPFVNDVQLDVEPGLFIELDEVAFDETDEDRLDDVFPRLPESINS